MTDTNADRPNDRTAEQTDDSLQANRFGLDVEDIGSDADDLDDLLDTIGSDADDLDDLLDTIGSDADAVDQLVEQSVRQWGTIEGEWWP